VILAVSKLMTNDGERNLKERIERLTREIEARNAACKQYAYDIACLTDEVRALHVKIDNLTSFSHKAVRGLHPGH
jgi:hypothetical protein